MEKRDTLLLVDDVEVNRAILRGIFEREYNLLEAENGDQALVLIEQYHGRIAAILLDLVMPVRDGYQVLEALGRRGLLAELPVIVITAEDSAASEVRAFDLGASDIIMKPFEPHVVRRRVQNVVELNLHKLGQQERIEEQAAKLRESNAVMVDALSSIIEYRSVETGQHIQRIRMFTRVLLEEVARCHPEYGLDARKIDMISSASSMHDIGKIAIPDAILNKPGRLTDEEFEIMKTHSQRGCEMLANLDRMGDQEYLQYAYNICRYHHERWDGRGYPDGLKGDAIPVCAQVVGIADCYDALTTDRVYRGALPAEQAFNMILNGECGSFSPRLLECFKSVQGAFAQLSQEYADGTRRTHPAAVPRRAPEPSFGEGALDSLQLSQMKYFTLLRYADATVMEADLTTGLYHLVYLASGDFELLRAGGCFEEAFRGFVKNAVHPDDQALALELLGDYLDEFFREGLMRRSRSYRVFSHATQAYRRCEATMLRIDTGHPRQRKVLIVWKELDPGAEAAPRFADGAALGALLGGVQVCRNDRWFTMERMNGSLGALLGYSEEEIRERFENRYLELIYPPDRDDALRQTRRQLQAGDAIELEYRLQAKDGRLVWTLDKGLRKTGPDGGEYLVRVLLDITQSKQAQEELRRTIERHKLIMEQSNDIIFEWDIERDEVLYSANWEKKFGYEPIREHASARIPQVSHVHPEDLPQFTRLISDMAGGVPYEEIEFRVADATGRYRWSKIRAAAQFNEAGKPYKAVGVIADIDEERRATEALRERAERDELTQLYNKSAGRGLIEDYFAKRPAQEGAALLIVDLDNFKQINDTYGHLFGDVVLREFSAELRRLFRGEDILSRIGGDEFLIFMRGVPDPEAVERRVDRVVESFRQMFRHDVLQGNPSCSIGISFCPADGQDFETLFRHADLALYGAKSKGKNCWRRFDAATMSDSFGLGTRQPVASTRIESGDLPETAVQGLVEQAFLELQRTDDLGAAIHAILGMIGKKFGVSRAYVLEDSRDGRITSNTFEWCNDGIESQKTLLQRIEYEKLGGRRAYLSLFNEEGVFYCPDVQLLAQQEIRALLMQQDIKSTLQCAIRDESGFRGFVGFDDCVIRRMWTREQIEALTFTSRLLSLFLLKRRAQEAAERAAGDLRTVLDHQNAWVYVVERGSWKLRYANGKTRRLAPQAREGAFCYRALFGRSEPCAHCPVREGATAGGTEMYNGRLGVWALVNATAVQWEGTPCHLLTCQDITDYKK